MRLVQNEGAWRDFKTCNDTPGATKHHGHSVACRSCSILMITSLAGVLSWFGTLLFPPSKNNVPHKATGKLRRLGRVNNVHASSIMLICHHNLLVFLAILLRVAQAGSSDSLNSTDGDRLVLSFEAVANLIWKSAHAIFLPQFGTCTANHQKKPLIFISTSWLMMWAHERWRQAEN